MCFISVGQANERGGIQAEAGDQGERRHTCRVTGENVLLNVQEKPTKEEVFKQKQVTKEKDAIHGVRLGAGDRSYLIRNNRIDVLKNQYGGVEVRPFHHS
jgi:hypothetical protein